MDPVRVSAGEWLLFASTAARPVGCKPADVCAACTVCPDVVVEPTALLGVAGGWCTVAGATFGLVVLLVLEEVLTTWFLLWCA